MACLKYAAKTPQQIANELFLTRITVRIHLATLLANGEVFRKFVPHNKRTNKPEYIYSSSRFPAYAHPISERDKRRAQALTEGTEQWDMAPVFKRTGIDV